MNGFTYSHTYPTTPLLVCSSNSIFTSYNTQQQYFYKLPAAHSATMPPEDYFRLTRTRDIFCQEEILSRYVTTTTTPLVELVKQTIGCASFHTTRDGRCMAKAVVVTGSPLPAFNGVYSARSCHVHAFFHPNGKRLVDKGNSKRWHLEHPNGNVHAWSSSWFNSGLPTGTREWRYLSGHDKVNNFNRINQRQNTTPLSFFCSQLYQSLI